MVIAVLGALFSGVTIVLGRMCNALLAKERGAPYSALMNYVTGLLGSLAVFFATGAAARAAFPAQGVSLTAYLGGALGLLGVYTLNRITHRLPATQLTLIIFLGQLFSGMLLDYFAAGRFSPGTALGGLLTLAGLAVSSLGDRRG